MDTYLTEEAAASARVFRVYRGDTTALSRGLRRVSLCAFGKRYVLDGPRFEWRGVRSECPLFFKRSILHALPKILEEPVLFLSFDTPRRNTKGIIFANPQDGTPESFIREIE